MKVREIHTLFSPLRSYLWTPTDLVLCIYPLGKKPKHKSLLSFRHMAHVDLIYIDLYCPQCDYKARQIRSD